MLRWLKKVSRNKSRIYYPTIKAGQMKSSEITANYELCKQFVSDRVFPLQENEFCEKCDYWPNKVGLEIEMIPFLRSSLEEGNPTSVPLHKGEVSFTSVLQGLAAERDDWKVDYYDSENSYILGITLEKGDKITFEPGGQVEFSSTPYLCLSEAVERMEAVQGYLSNAFRESGIEFIQLGMNPWKKVDEIGLQMDKPRYKAMDNYFSAIGPFGRRMMRQTSTIQVNLDWGSNESLLAKRYLLANLLAPFGTAIFANSSISDGHINDFLSFRAFSWQRLDPTRTGIPSLTKVAKELSKESCVDSYMNFVMRSKVVFFEKLGFRVNDLGVNFEDWLKKSAYGISPSMKDFETHLSLSFPEVRPRGFLEVRSVDCQSRVWQSAPAAFYASLIYDEKNLDDALELLLPYLDRLDDLLKSSVYGLSDDLVNSLSDKLMTMAIEGFDRLPTCYQGKGTNRLIQKFYDLFTSQRETPASHILKMVQSTADQILTYRGLSNLEDKWRNFVEK